MTKAYDLPVQERRWFVERDNDSGYKIRRYHRDQASATADTKMKAVKKASKIAKNHSSKKKRSQVKIRDGGSFSKVIDFVDGQKL